MKESTTKTTRHFTACASLAALGVKLRQLDVFGPIRKTMRVAQKAVKYTPIDKLYDAFISLLAGAQGLVEINTRLRSDPALQAAFGRNRCAEQSVVQETLDACTAENVAQMEQALDSIYRQHSQGYRHNYAHDWQILVRIDAGGGSVDDVNWLLARGYQIHGKDYSSPRAQRLAASVQYWVDDPKVEGRQVGWVQLPAPEYVRPVRRIAVRCRKANGQWGIGVLISTLCPDEMLALTQSEAAPDADPSTVLLAYVYLYDQRGGGVETSFKGDKQGLGSTTRNKKRFEAQQMVMVMGTLAHNVVIWARRWLTEAAPPCQLRHYGMLRMVRDVFHVTGFLVFDALISSSRLCSIRLRFWHPCSLTRYGSFSLPCTLPLIWAKLRYIRTRTCIPLIHIDINHFTRPNTVE